MGTRLEAFGACVVLFACAGFLARCIDNSSTTPDAAAPDAGNFTLSLTPNHVTEDPGDSFPVTINVSRATGFTDVVTFTITTPPSLTATQPAPAGSTSLFYLSASDAGTPGPATVIVTGTSGSSVQKATLDVLVGSVIVVDGGTFTPPAFATALTVKVWGAGGASGQDCPSTMGGNGGGGGFASGTLTVTSGEAFVVLVGTGGVYTSGTCGSGGGGGGYSAVELADGGVVLLAGGGGGGGSGSGATNGNGGAGAGGGGLTGGGPTQCVTSGGTQDAGGAGCFGAAPGTTLQGGEGAGDAGNAGGVPGGGRGSTTSGLSGNGGGGGGWFGGAGAGTTGVVHVGGGGGSGFNALDGGTLTAATGATAASTSDPDYQSGVGAGGQNASGGPGRIVVRLQKP